MKPITKSKAEVVSELRSFILKWKTVHRLTDHQVVAYMAMIAGPYGEASYVTLKHHSPPGTPHD